MLAALLALSFSALASGKSKWLGNIIASSVPSNWGTYWNQVSPENGGKWGSVETSRGNYNWKDADTAYNYAKQNGLKFKWHTFVWGSQEPNWIGSLSAADKKSAISSYIAAVAQRYPSPDFIDVVNEALHAPSSIRDALGGSGSTGWDWIVWSFQEAKSRFGSATLLINEYGIINDGNAIRQYLEIVNVLKGKGLIGGIGIQCHQFNINDLSAATITSNLNSLAAAGLPIYVSELDINGNSESDQSQKYQRVFPALWQHSSVKGITLWGYISGQTWKDGTGIVESNGNERQAMTWLKSYFASSASNV
uniref:Putative glycosyl hydrolase family10 n=1 Tax=uncultured symbiotic protist of Cryptocercus punctulatus TaxID=403662 RepID=A4UX64_9EUKA|nr:putative glycosyl hydrolase family10 [uncultured symbiotic protist of Cryptocercus punctulatus]